MPQSCDLQDGVVEDPILLGCYASLLGYRLPTLRRNITPESIVLLEKLTVSQPVKEHNFFKCQEVYLRVIVKYFSKREYNREFRKRKLFKEKLYVVIVGRVA